MPDARNDERHDGSLDHDGQSSPTVREERDAVQAEDAGRAG